MERKTVLVLALIACVATAGIATYFLVVGVGPLQILIKDAPYDDLVSINVDIAAIEVHKVDRPNWITLMQGQEKRLNCSVTGEVEQICNSDLSPGTYDIIRIKFNNIKLHYNNGSLYELNKFQNQIQIQNYWLEIPINFTYDGAGGEVLFDVSVNSDYEAVVTIVQTVS